MLALATLLLTTTLAVTPTGAAHCSWQYGPGAFAVGSVCVGFMADENGWRCTGVHSHGTLDVGCAGFTPASAALLLA